MDISRYIDADQVASRLGISRQSVYNLVNRSPDFPKPTKVGRASLWLPKEVDGWRAKHPARRPKTPKEDPKP